MGASVSRMRDALCPVGERTLYINTWSRRVLNVFVCWIFTNLV